MKPAEIRELTTEELAKQEAQLRHELLNLRIQQTTGALQNSARIRQIKRDIARIKTEQRKRQLQ